MTAAQDFYIILHLESVQVLHHHVNVDVKGREKKEQLYNPFQKVSFSSPQNNSYKSFN